MADKEYEEWLAKQGKPDAPGDEPDDEPEEAKAVEPGPTVDQSMPLGSALSGVVGGPAGIEMDTTTDDRPVREVDVTTPDPEALARHDAAKAKQQDSVWYAVVGVALLFVSSFHWGLGVGGMFMVLYGIVRYIHFGRIAKHAFDPWDDPEIDAWEQEEMR